MLSARARCLAVWWATTLTALGLGQVLVPAVTELLPPSGGPLRFDEVLVGTCAVVGLGAAAWLWLLVSLVTLEVLHRGSSRGRLVPAAIRPLVLAACGLTLTGALTGPASAQADRPVPAPGRAAVPAAAALLDGLPLPDRPLSTSRTHRRDVAVVRPGDSLWDIAARLLPPDASISAVNVCSHRLQAHNRDRIGPDPDLIHPGQRLDLPEC